MTTPEQIHVSFDWGGLALAGSLHLPSGTGPHPAVVMAQGSGPADRESGGYFVPIRRTFLDRGIATFAFDKPGCGASTGDWRHYGLIGRADQTVAALDVIRIHPAVDPDRVGIWGHSQGGWLVQMIAGGPNELAFAIASSGPTIDVRDQILYDCEHTMRDLGYDDDDVQDALTLARALQQAADDGDDFESIFNRLLEPAGHRSWYGSFQPPHDADDWRHVKLLVSDPFDPLHALSRIECPFLAIFGGRDLLLPPWKCAEQSGDALASAGNLDSTIVVFPGGDHRLHGPGTEDFVHGYLNLLGDWVARRALHPPPNEQAERQPGEVSS